MVSTQTLPRLTLDVHEDAPLELRRRLRALPETAVVALLPGGLILEDDAETQTYRLMAGSWNVREQDGGFCLWSDAGHELRIDGGRLTLAIAK